MCLLLMAVSVRVFAQNTPDVVEITGVVLGDNKEPLVGVNITVKDVPGLGTNTDLDGRYKIKLERYQRLVFSYVGYDKQEVLVKDQYIVDVNMKSSESNILDQIVVTAVGTQKKATVTGAITTVDVNDLRVNPTGAVSNALAGNVPGVLARQTSGMPGSVSEFWIRGISTFGASNAALVLVDGFERNLDEINVEDIESFSVLKDASTTAIYGSRGANGVVLVTTKRGAAGKVNIDAKVEAGYNMLTKVPQFVEGPQYARMANEARLTRNQEPIFQPDELEILRLGLDPDLYPNVNWKDIILRDGATNYRASLNVKGGGSTARYFISGSYLNQQGMYKTDNYLKDYSTNAGYRRWNYRLNLDIDITKTTLVRVGVSGSLEKFNDTGLGSDKLWNAIMDYNPILSPLIYSNGYVPAFGTNDRTNPWVQSTMTGYRENWNNNIQTNITLEQNLDFFLSGLRFIARYGYDTENKNSIRREKWPEQWKAERFRDINGNLVFQRVSTEGKLTQSSEAWGNRNEFFEWDLHYDRSLKRHNFGGTVKYNQFSKVETVGIDKDIKRGIARRNQGIAGRATYRFDYRYFLEFNFGYTGSENFAKGHRFGFFPAISGAWNIAEESFMKNNFKWITFLKVRYSYGKVGNDNLGKDEEDRPIRFPYLYTIDNAGGYNFGDYGFKKEYAGKYYSEVASPYVTWEIATKKDLGIDIALFRSKFTATIDFFDEKREGIYMVRNYLPMMVGLESNPRANVGKVKSKGFDGNFSINQKVGEIDFTLRGNMTYSKNEIVDRDEEERYYKYQMERGHRVDQARGLVSLGLFKDWDDIRNSPQQTYGSVMPGDIKYKDVNGDGIVNDDDRVAIGATTKPNLIFGLGTSARWKGFDVNVHFQGAGKSTFFINGPTVYMFQDREGWGNILSEMANSDRWISEDISGSKSTENPNAAYPRLSYGGNGNNYRESTFWLRDGSYVRLKTLEAGYSLPKYIVNRFRLEGLRFFFIGTNLLTWSNFKLWDPEMGSSDGKKYPNSKTYLFGISINL